LVIDRALQNLRQMACGVSIDQKRKTPAMAGV